jgi:membrane-bound lytic murein transglycosylase B
MKLGLSAFVAVLTLLIAPIASAADHNFAKWLVELRQEAKELGISDRILDAALGNAAPIKRVIELDRRQPEFTMTFDKYLSKIASPTRARIAAKMLVEHDEILTKVSKKYGVQKRYIVTFWGVETNFGQYLGSLMCHMLWQHWPLMAAEAPISQRTVECAENSGRRPYRTR